MATTQQTTRPVAKKKRPVTNAQVAFHAGQPVPPPKTLETPTERLAREHAEAETLHLREATRALKIQNDVAEGFGQLHAKMQVAEAQQADRQAVGAAGGCEVNLHRVIGSALGATPARTPTVAEEISTRAEHNADELHAAVDRLLTRLQPLLSAEAPTAPGQAPAYSSTSSEYFGMLHQSLDRGAYGISRLHSIIDRLPI